MKTAAAPPLPADLEELLRRLRLPHIRRHAPEVVATAKAQRWEPAEVLKALFAEEVAGRERSALATRRAAAGFPTGKTFDAWQPDASSIPARQCRVLAQMPKSPRGCGCRHPLRCEQRPNQQINNSLEIMARLRCDGNRRRVVPRGLRRGHAHRHKWIDDFPDAAVPSLHPHIRGSRDGRRECKRVSEHVAQGVQKRRDGRSDFRPLVAEVELGDGPGEDQLRERHGIDAYMLPTHRCIVLRKRRGPASQSLNGTAPHTRVEMCSGSLHLGDLSE